MRILRMKQISLINNNKIRKIRVIRIEKNYWANSYIIALKKTKVPRLFMSSGTYMFCV